MRRSRLAMMVPLLLANCLLLGCRPAGSRQTAQMPLQVHLQDERLQMELARNHFENGDFELARKEFVRLILNQPNPYIQEVSHYMVGESYYRQKDYAQAMRYFAHYVKDYPAGSRRAESDVRLSQCTQQLELQAQAWERGKLRQMQASPPVVQAAPSKKSKGQSFQVTWYWVEAEANHDDQERTPLLDVQGRVLAHVSAAFHKRLLIEGTGRLRDGRVVNWAAPGRFMVVGAESPFGLGARGKPLIPLRTIAVDPKLVPLDTVVYVAELDGMELPNNERHDGCLVAGDVGSAIRGAHIDIFAPTYEVAMPILQKLPERLVLRRPASHCLVAYDLSHSYH